MPITYTVDKEQNVVFVTWQGDVTAEVLRAHVTKVVADPDAFGCGRTLLDLRHGSTRIPGPEILAIGRQEVVSRLAGRKWKTAILTENAGQYGIGRQHEIGAGDFASESVFTDYDAALAWLVKD